MIFIINNKSKTSIMYAHLIKSIYLYYMTVNVPSITEKKDFFVSLSPEDYKSAIDVLTQTSQHNRLISDTIRKTLCSSKKPQATLLDVGSGPGIIAKNVQNLFSKVTAIEPNKQMVPLYAESDIELHTCNFSEFESSSQYDLVLSSHVMYHMPYRSMEVFIDKLLHHTKPGGICLIAMMADRGENHFLHQKFNKNYINSSQIKSILTNKGIKFQVISDTNHFTAENHKQMLTLCRFFVFEDCLQREFLDSLSTEDAHALNEQISSICNQLEQKDGTYRLNQEEDYILIYRENSTSS